jgi:GTPase SAR1 family protein
MVSFFKINLKESDYIELREDFDDNESDVYVNNHEIRKIKDLLFEKGCVVNHRISYEPHCKVTHISSFGDLSHLDIVDDIYLFDKSRGIKINKNDEVDFTNEMRYILLLLHSVFDKEYKSKSIYYKILECRNSSLNRKKLKNSLSQLLIPGIIFNKIEKCFYANSFFILRFILKPLVVFWMLLIRPCYVFKWVFHKLYRLADNVKNKYLDEKIIVFMGADGSGKTAIIEELIKESDDEWTYIHLGNKGSFLPTTKLINKYRSNKRKKLISEAPENDLYVTPGNNNFYSVAKNYIYHINYNLEIYLHLQYLRIKCVFKNKKIRILIDRYIYESKQCESYSSGCSVFPAPNLIVLMNAPIEVLLNRKDEHDEKTIKIFVNNYKSFVKSQRVAPSIMIDSTKEMIHNIKKVENALAIFV